MVVGIRQTSSATSTVIETGVALARRLHRVDRERQQRRAGEQEDERELGEQDGERDLVRRALALGAFDQRDHAVEEGLARVGA